MNAEFVNISSPEDTCDELSPVFSDEYSVGGLHLPVPVDVMCEETQPSVGWYGAPRVEVGACTTSVLSVAPCSPAGVHLAFRRVGPDLTWRPPGGSGGGRW